MSFSKLPEELLREILAYALYIPHEDFCKPPKLDSAAAYCANTDEARRSASRCGLLLVSKRWLRVGTPLLYECLRISRRKHASKILKLLQANPRVGSAVRCLRLEGTYSKKLVDIVKLTPKVQTLYIDMDLEASARINGLLRSIPLLNPQVLLVRDASRESNQQKREICNAIAECLNDGTWSALTYTNLQCARMTSRLAKALRRAPGLHELVLQTTEASQWLAAGYMRKIAENPDLRWVTCCIASKSDETHRWILQEKLNEKRIPYETQKIFIFEPGSIPAASTSVSMPLRDCNAEERRR